MICSKCGTELVDGAMFCHKCGAKAEGNAANSQVKVGDIITHGSLEYSICTAKDEYATRKAPITWRVLDITNEGNLFVVSEDVLDLHEFNPWTDGRTDWEHSSLRKWLNDEFLNKAFNTQEQTRILTVNVKNSTENNDCPDTMDKLFLLSTEEVEKFFVPDDPNNKKGPSKDRQCYMFHKAEIAEAYNKYSEYPEHNYIYSWRLRTVYKSGNGLRYPCGVNADGSWKGSNDLDDIFNTYDQPLGIRPAMVIKP